eukprot:439987-Prorocentrum_minimum.AAC.1
MGTHIKATWLPLTFTWVPFTSAWLPSTSNLQPLLLLAQGVTTVNDSQLEKRCGTCTRTPVCARAHRHALSRLRCPKPSDLFVSTHKTYFDMQFMLSVDADITAGVFTSGNRTAVVWQIEGGKGLLLTPS